MFRIGVLASTKGTDLQAIIDELKAGRMPGIELAIVLSNKKSAYALERARALGFKAIFVNPENHTLEEFDKKLIELLHKYKVDLICLIGYMRILTPAFIRAFKGRIINVHPALLPKFGGPNFYGKNVHEAVLKSHEKFSGMTIHWVTEDVDKGPIIIQKKVKIAPHETPGSLKQKVQSFEKKWYPEVIRQIAKGKIKFRE